jgi:putative DNA primase/helicase
MRGRYTARELRGIARVPRIDDDGQIHFAFGYDPVTRLYQDKTPDFEVPASPSRADAQKASKALLLPFSEYQFENQVTAEAVVLGMVLTAIERPYLPTAPMLIIRSSMAGTGKGLLVRSVVQLSYDTSPVVATWGATPEETEKRIAALLLQSPAAICVDNANGKLIHGDLLESIITEGRADIRILGRSEIVRVHNRSLLMLTGNNPQITGDMARRTLALDIHPRSADPERDCYNIKPIELIRECRTDFLMDAFTIMRAYRLAGMPNGGLPDVGSFEEWSRRVRNIVHWLTDYDLADGFSQNKAEDPYRQDDASLLGALHGMYGLAPFTSSDVISVYGEVAKGTPPIGAIDLNRDALYAALDVVLGSRNAKQFGYWARRVKGAHIGGFQLNVERDPSTNANRISVKRTSAPQSGMSGSTGSLQPYC